MFHSAASVFAATAQPNNLHLFLFTFGFHSRHSKQVTLFNSQRINYTTVYVPIPTIMNNNMFPNFRELIPAVWRQAGELLTQSQRLRLMGTTAEAGSTEQRVHQAFKAAVPLLNSALHKGECGRIGVVGGSAEYTGAPYYAAIASLKVGADLSHVFCPPEAATVIKSYSPELIVHPLLTQETIQEMLEWVKRMHCVVIGPGLGRKPELAELISFVVQVTKTARIPLIIDADGLFFATANPELITHNPLTVLTPNVVEFTRLHQAVLGELPVADDYSETVASLSTALANVTIVHKGHADIIASGSNVVKCTYPGSPRRCGGQGDVLCGALATFAHWTHAHYECEPPDEEPTYSATMLAAYASCLLTKTCSSAAFSKTGRSMTTVDLIEQISTCLPLIL